MSADFNEYKDTYKREVDKSIRFSGQPVEFFTEIKAKIILESAKRLNGDITRLEVLDLGCGNGLTDMFLVNEFQILSGIDVASEAVEKAKVLNPTVDYKVYDGSELPFHENKFDIVFIICVMHHLQIKQRYDFLAETKRVLKEGGLLMIFEHNPLNYFTRYAVLNCEFDKDALLITKTELKKLIYGNGFSLVDENYIIFFPFRGKLFRFIEKGLRRLPLGAQYYLIAQK